MSYAFFRGGGVGGGGENGQNIIDFCFAAPLQKYF